MTTAQKIYAMNQNDFNTVNDLADIAVDALADDNNTLYKKTVATMKNILDKYNIAVGSFMAWANC